MTPLRGMIPMLAVADMSRALNFYQHALGFRIRDSLGDPPHWCMLESGPVRLMLDEREPGQLTPAADPARSQFSCYLYPQDLAAFHRHIVSLGYPAPPPATTPYGMFEFRMRDPDGHHLWCGQLPPTSTLFPA